MSRKKMIKIEMDNKESKDLVIKNTNLTEKDIVEFKENHILYLS